MIIDNVEKIATCENANSVLGIVLFLAKKGIRCFQSIFVLMRKLCRSDFMVCDYTRIQPQIEIVFYTQLELCTILTYTYFIMKSEFW